jgi:hypothetical protein
MDRLRDLAAQGDVEAIQVLDQLAPLIDHRDALIQEGTRALGLEGSGGGEPQFEQPKEGHAGAGEERFETPREGKVASEKPPHSGAEPRGAGTSAEEASAAASRVEGAAAEAEEALIDRIGSGVGSVAEGLLPTPLDALIMEGQYAGAYEDAWEAIEERNTRGGITFGITAGIMDFDWAWVRENLARRTADRDFNTEFAGAAGKAESAFNDGLKRGHVYGFGHPPGLKKKILARAFGALAQRGTKVPENERRSFDTLTRLAGVLTPIVDDFYAKSPSGARRARRPRRSGASCCTGASDAAASNCVHERGELRPRSRDCGDASRGLSPAGPLVPQDPPVIVTETGRPCGATPSDASTPRRHGKSRTDGSRIRLPTVHERSAPMAPAHGLLSSSPGDNKRSTTKQ